ncbi:MAG: UvrD-helicase domain-containing protein [Mariprofundaceae bacterium]
MGKGVFFYRDFYLFAEKSLLDLLSIASNLQKRFPHVFLDEMQDTQKFQDELITKVFPLDGEEVVVQRFGDADQAIFHGINNEEPNESYNCKTEGLCVINQSHRFDDSIAQLIKGMSFNGVSLASELSGDALEKRKNVNTSSGDFEHTIFLFDDEDANHVIEAFAEHVSRQFTDDHKRSDKFSVKVVGAVGNEIDGNNQLKIGHYWNDFKKNKSSSSFKEACLHEAVIHCCKLTDVDWAERHKLLNVCFLRMLRLAGKKDSDGNYINASSMKEYTKEKGDWEGLRKIGYALIKFGTRINNDDWDELTDHVLQKLGIDDASHELAEYLQYRGAELEQFSDEDKRCQGGSVKPYAGNKLIHNDGFAIEFSTIHGVKGETHDATLVLETKNYNFDMELMLPYLTGDLPDESNPNSSMKEKPSNARKPNQKFMRQLYVAMSRPKHLLCLAIRSDHINIEQKRFLDALGWRLKTISAGSD